MSLETSKRGTIEELRRQKETVDRWWKFNRPHEVRPLSCVDCARQFCLYDCKGIEDKRVERI